MSFPSLILQQENGDPKISFDNILKCICSHGIAIAAIHTIKPRGEQTTHFFFHDGWDHEANGFLIGNHSNTLERKKVLFLKAALNNIPFLSPFLSIPVEYLLENGNEKQIKEMREADEFVNINYLFRSPDELATNLIKNSNGLNIFERFINTLAKDIHHANIEGSW